MFPPLFPCCPRCSCAGQGAFYLRFLCYPRPRSALPLPLRLALREHFLTPGHGVSPTPGVPLLLVRAQQIVGSVTNNLSSVRGEAALYAHHEGETHRGHPAPGKAAAAAAPGENKAGVGWGAARLSPCKLQWVVWYRCQQWGARGGNMLTLTPSLCPHRHPEPELPPGLLPLPQRHSPQLL